VIWADPVAARFFAWIYDAGLLGLRVRIPPWAWMFAFVNVVCCQVEVSATGRSLVQRKPIECVRVCHWSRATITLCYSRVRYVKYTTIFIA